jgi:hypothetical protein
LRSSSATNWRGAKPTAWLGASGKRASAMGNIDAARLRAVVLAHAHEIAGTASAAPEDGVVLALVHDEGRWLGGRVVAPDTMRSAAERETSEGFYLPATCRTPEQVRQFIDESLSDWKE